jgi:hypothetical protein
MILKRKGQVAVVTGAGGTLCSEMARSLAAQGMSVALIGRDMEKLVRVEQEIKEHGGTALSVSADVADQKKVEEAFKLISKELGRCVVLINGAGGNQSNAITTTNEFNEVELDNTDPDYRGFFNLSMQDFKNVIEVNTMGTVIPSFIFGKEMARHKQGCIINIASMNSYRPLSRVGAYGIAKAGIANFTQWLAAYLAPANIRVNAIAPGFFLNERSKKLLLTPSGYSERGYNIIKHTPMKRFGEAPELVGCMNWLIDDEAAGFVTGTIIPIDGGFISSSGV